MWFGLADSIVFLFVGWSCQLGNQDLTCIECWQIVVAWFAQQSMLHLDLYMQLGS